MKRQAAMRSLIKTHEIRTGESSNCVSSFSRDTFDERSSETTLQVENVNDDNDTTSDIYVLCFSRMLFESMWAISRVSVGKSDSNTISGFTHVAGLKREWGKEEKWLWSWAKKSLPTYCQGRKLHRCHRYFYHHLFLSSGTCLEASLPVTLTFSLLLSESEFRLWCGEKHIFCPPILQHPLRWQCHLFHNALSHRYTSATGG